LPVRAGRPGVFYRAAAGRVAAQAKVVSSQAHPAAACTAATRANTHCADRERLPAVEEGGFI
jgi:hypothetical protein